MEKKKYGPKEAFWVCFILALVCEIVFWVYLSIEVKSDFTMFSRDGLLLIIELLFANIMVGCFGAALRKNKMREDEKDQINEMMREYLEKKLREEDNK